MNPDLAQEGSQLIPERHTFAFPGLALRKPSAKELVATVRSLALALMLLTVSGLSRSAAAVPISWAFEGSVSSVNNFYEPADLSVDARFRGVIHFDTTPGWSNIIESVGVLQSFTWQEATIGIELIVDDVFDFSIVGSTDGFLSLTVRDDIFSSASREDQRADDLHFTAGQGLVRNHFGDFSYMSDLYIVLADHEHELFSDVDLPLDPPALQELEVARLYGKMPFGSGHLAFAGRLDRLFVVPEPASVLLVSIGLAALALFRQRLG